MDSSVVLPAIDASVETKSDAALGLGSSATQRDHKAAFKPYVKPPKREQLELLLNSLLQNDDPMPYSFCVDETDITTTLFQDIIHGLGKSSEHMLTIKYQPQAVFKVRTVSRCTASLAGHTESILSVCFSPDGKSLATGSGTVWIYPLLLLHLSFWAFNAC
ncbi:hypothetical protein BASA81_011468 [Batrachochytrium salamandrivorans]|nr:hypothetical protein BASA81_011468 [Batrachochytrium salamandrivorans]